MNSTSMSLAIALVFTVGLLVGQTTGQEPVRIDKPGTVQVLPNQNIQELSDLLVKYWNPPEITDALLAEVWRKCEGAARSGEPNAALIVMRIRKHQAESKK